MDSELFLSLAVSLALTLLIELAFAFVMRVKGRDLLVVLLANCLTNPPVVLLHHLLGGTVLIIAVLEVSAVLVEWGCYRAATDIKRPLLFSLTANAISYGLGLVIQMF